MVRAGSSVEHPSIEEAKVRIPFAAAWAIFFSPHCLTSLSCTNEYRSMDSGGNVKMNSVCEAITPWLNRARNSW